MSMLKKNGKLLSSKSNKKAKSGAIGNIKPKKVQSVLNLPEVSSNRRTSCYVCGMTYIESIPKEKDLHYKYHNSFVNGIHWSLNSDDNIIQEVSLVEKINGDRLLFDKSRTTHKTVKGVIITINKESKLRIKKVNELLKMVNQELNAPESSIAWQDVSKEAGKAFIVVIENTAVGICITEPIDDVEYQGKWMVLSSQRIVPGRANLQVRVGISRIWIAPRWRRFGLAKKLLNSILSNLIYGITIEKNNVAFSQPSNSGGLLAKRFNGVRHKSGEILIPVYIEI